MTKDELSLILTKLDMLDVSINVCAGMIRNDIMLIAGGGDPGIKSLEKEQKRLADLYHESAGKYIDLYNEIYGEENE